MYNITNPLMRSWFTKLTNSFKYLLKGFIYCKNNKTIWKYIIIAVILNLIAIFFTILAIGLALNLMFDSITSLLNININSEAGIFISVLLFLPGVFFSYILFGFISSIANAPVYGHMSEFIVKDLYKNFVYNDLGFINDVLNSISFESKKVFVSLIILILTLPLNAIPILGSIIYFFINIFQVIIFAGIDMLEPILSRNQISFRDKVEIVLSNPLDFWPYFLVSGFFYTVPVVNIFLIPIFMVGATIMYIDFKKEEVKN